MILTVVRICDPNFPDAEEEGWDKSRTRWHSRFDLFEDQLPLDVSSSIASGGVGSPGGSSAGSGGGTSCCSSSVAKSLPPTISKMRERIASLTGVPPGRHRYHGVSEWELAWNGDDKYKFRREPVFRGGRDDEGKPVGDKLVTDALDELGLKPDVLGVALLPPARDLTEEKKEEVEVDEEDEDEDEEDEEGEGEYSAVAPAAAAVGASADEEAAPSALRLWLRDLESEDEGVPAGRFERYASRFEKHFATLDHLALILREEGEDAWKELFTACRIMALGDRWRIKRAIRSLPVQE
eukprot:CAMPEP_0113588456 /NCGR_PEP_ID=MMETSP0015_2-20120614/35522_1 /TAXON_ID=2838 /ORGANISM="Odontella" /LENGTH=294 /DNA_ID=CAMNT_0000494325 /DNA_START=59 /DNA_END=943 /DNA_ORIENTATION=+ /assembly_acc=CAM_ASM_000160